MTLTRMTMSSPAGDVLLVASDKGVVAILWNADRYSYSDAVEDPSHPVLRQLVKELEEYFAGSRQAFDLPLDMRGTEFQKQVWQALLEIPYGTTSTYGEIAAKLGKPSASRAVGMANGRNPISILVPCHRVIGSNGSLTGYAGGLKSKEHLLGLERGARAQMAFEI